MFQFTEYKTLCDSLSDESKLVRERELVKFITFIKNCSESDVESFLKYNVSCLNTDKWFILLGNLNSIFYILKLKIYKNPNFYVLEDLKIKNMQLLNFDEYRVRISAGEVLSELFKYFCKDKLCEYHLFLVNQIQANLKEDNQSREPSRMSFNGNSSLPNAEIELPVSHKILTITSGWKKLETTIKFFEVFLKENPNLQNDFISNELLDLFIETFNNPNRFVRESSFNTLKLIFQNGNLANNHKLDNYMSKITPILSNGMCDNWSQVRYASLQATRAYLLSYLKDEVQLTPVYLVLLPKICLNRYYLAEGVRLYAQELWENITKGRGKNIVESNIAEFVTYYIEATKADNHAVREAGCHCIAELANKIDPQLLQPHALTLIEVLIQCFKDDSWPVRDTACLASGSFIFKFPDETTNYMEQFYPFFFQNLGDPIASVRQGAALSLSKVAKVYGKESLDILEEKIVKSLQDVDKQESDLEDVHKSRADTNMNSMYRNASTSPSPILSQVRDHVESQECQTSQFGIVKLPGSQNRNRLSPIMTSRQPLSDLHDPKHTDQTMYSCGSLAPKMKASGCSGTGFQRDSAYWEIADGCLLLVSELIKNDKGDLVTQLVQRIFPLMVLTVQKRHYSQHYELLSTFLKQLPVIIRCGITKQFFKSHLEPVVESVFYALHCEHESIRIDAIAALKNIAEYLGPNILRGRIENQNPNYIDEFEKVMR